MNQSLATPVGTDSLEGDIRAIVHRQVDLINGPVGAAIRSLLPAMHHQPALTEAFQRGPLQAWRDSYARTWAAAQARGEAPAGMEQSVYAETCTALLVQRWLLTSEPVTHDYADETLDKVVLPLLRSLHP